jgi:hypothetical protein
MEDMMRRRLTMATGVLAVSLGGCVSYHHEAAAQRMARPKDLDPAMAGYVAPDPVYPSVGGDILKGASAHTEAPDDVIATPTPLPDGPDNSITKRRVAHALETTPS